MKLAKTSGKTQIDPDVVDCGFDHFTHIHMQDRVEEGSEQQNTDHLCQPTNGQNQETGGKNGRQESASRYSNLVTQRFTDTLSDVKYAICRDSFVFAVL